MEQLEEDVRCPMRQESTTTREGKDPQDDRSASYVYGMETVPVTSSHVKKLEVTEMKVCRWACGHTLRDHVRNENIKERLKVESIAERCRKAWLRWFGHVKRRDQERLWRWYHPGEESEEDRNRDGWTVSTETWEPSEQQKTRSMTELVGGELCMPQRPYNQVGAARRRRISSS